MTREELLSALELSPDPMGPVDLDSAEGPRTPAAPPSPTALQLDDWSLRRGAESLRGDILGPILAPGLQEPITINGTPVHWIPPLEQSLIAADCLAAAFEPEPRLAENCADETRGRYFRQLMETEAYQALHSQTRLDTLASELAAGHFAQGFIALADQEQSQETPEGQPQKPQDGAREEMRKDLRALSAAAGALQQANQDVSDLRDAQRAMGDDPSNPTNLDPSSLKARFDRIRQSGRLRAIIEHAGRYRRLAQAKQRQKTRHGQDDVVGVELGNDLGRLLPAELAALADDDLELDALRRYLERGLMQRELRGVEHKARGPVVVVVDESGSMSGGGRIETAKALALAMAWIARHQRRYCCLVGFADDARGNWLICPPGHTDQDALLDWLGHFYSGGTSASVPLITLPERWEQIGAPRGQTDVILITDGLLSFDDGTRDRFNAWKARETVKLYTLIIDEEEPGDLDAVSDRVWCLPDLSIETEAIQEIVSI